MDRNHVSQRILDLTLEVISLLTGETFAAVRSGDLVAIKAPSHYFAIPKKTNKKKVLEVTNKIIELLTGEVPIRRKGDTERQFLEGHQMVMMEDQATDGSRKRNPRKRSLGPLYSQDTTREDQETLCHHQGDVLLNIKVEDLDGEELYEECAEQYKEKQESSPEVGLDDIGKTSRVQPALSPDCDIEDKNFSCDGLGENPIIEIETTGPSNSKESFADKSLAPTPDIHAGPRRSSNQSKKPSLSLSEGATFHPGPHSAGRSSDPSNAAPDSVFKTADQSNSQESSPDKSLIGTPSIHVGPRRSSGSSKKFKKSLSLSEGSTFSLGAHSGGSSSDPCNPGLDSVFTTADQPNCEESSPNKSLAPSSSIHPRPQGSSDQSKESSLSASEEATPDPDYSGDNKLYPCCQCGKTFMLQLIFGGRQRKEREPFTCCECQTRSTAEKTPRCGPQENDEAGAKYYACPKCPKTFSRKTYLVHHQRIHREDCIYSCSECGRCFTNKSNLVVHARTHTGERPFPCFMCGKSFTHRSSLVRHLRAHMR